MYSHVFDERKTLFWSFPDVCGPRAPSMVWEAQGGTGYRQGYRIRGISMLNFATKFESSLLLTMHRVAGVRESRWESQTYFHPVRVF